MVQAITDHAAFLAEAKQAVEQLERFKSSLEQQREEEARAKRALEAELKATQDAVTLTVKKRREEISASYDKEIAKGQELLKKARMKREKAKSQGMQERIDEETSELHAHNRELKLQLKTLFQQEHLPGFARSRFFYMLYLPGHLLEFLELLAVILLVFGALPAGIYWLIPVASRRTWKLILIYLADILLFGSIYMTIGNYTKMAHLKAMRQGRLILDTIQSNMRKVHVISTSIRRDRNESLYDLEKYDDEISKTEQDLMELTGKKKDAIGTFNTVTQTILSDEIVNSSKSKIDQLKDAHDRAQERLTELEQQVKELSLRITDTYEIYIGREYMQPDRLSELARLIRTGEAANISEAILVDRANRNAAAR